MKRNRSRNKKSSPASPVVTKSNELVRASYRLTLDEQRLILAAISKINTAKGLSKGFYFTVSAEEFSSMFGLGLDASYWAIKEASSKLYDRDIRVFNSKGTKERFRWLFHVRYKSGEGSVEMGFSPNVVTHLVKLKGNFTSYHLEFAAKLNTSYSVRIYEMCKQFEKTGLLKIPLVDIRTALGIEDKYKIYQDFSRRILAPSVKSINSLTDIDVVAEPYRKGRKIAGVIFTIKAKEQADMFL